VRSSLLFAAVLASVPLLAACGGASSSSGGVASIAGSGSDPAATTTPANATDREAALLKAAQCMRANGVKNFPDPTVDADGGVRLQFQGISRTDPGVQAALQKCRSLFAAARPQFTPQQQQKLQDTLLAFAKCMRKNGYNMPDPQFGTGGGGPGGGLFRSINRNDPAFQKANTACRSILAGAFPGRGPGGGGFGGPPPGGGSGAGGGAGGSAAPAPSGATP
jgi:hypothetical protein